MMRLSSKAEVSDGTRSAPTGMGRDRDPPHPTHAQTKDDK